MTLPPDLGDTARFLELAIGGAMRLPLRERAEAFMVLLRQSCGVGSATAQGIDEALRRALTASSDATFLRVAGPALDAAKSHLEEVVFNTRRLILEDGGSAA